MQRTGLDRGSKGNVGQTRNERREQNRANLSAAHYNPALTEKEFDVFVSAVLTPVNKFSKSKDFDNSSAAERDVRATRENGPRKKS